MANEPVAALSVRQLKKSYGEIHAVDGVDLELTAGSVVALLGPNGSGKSTTVSMLLGLLSPDAGRISVYGHAPAEAVRRGLVGAMPQHGGYPNSAKVREVVRLVRRLYADPLPMDEIVERTGIGDLLGLKGDRLSGGQLPRGRLATAIAGDPRLLILDEPTVGLDVDARAAFWRCIREFGAGTRTVLFSTHYLEEADANADHVIVLSHGRVLIEGSSAQIKHRTTHRAVAFDLAGADIDGLDRLPGVTDVALRGDRVLLRTDDSDATVGALYARCGSVRNLELTGGSLEEAFSELTANAAASNTGAVGRAADAVGGAGPVTAASNTDSAADAADGTRSAHTTGAR